MGLLKAIEKYNPSKGSSFKYYANKVIESYIKRGIHNILRTIKFPTNFLSDYYSLEVSKYKFRDKFNRMPSDEELAYFMIKSVKYVKNMKQHREYLYDVVSLDSPALEEGDDELVSMISDESSSFENKILDKIALCDFNENYVFKLSDKSKFVLFERLKNKSLDEIAFCAGEVNLNLNNSKKVLTKQRTGQISKKGVIKIKKLREFEKER